jgi:hypothetical protein
MYVLFCTGLQLRRNLRETLGSEQIKSRTFEPLLLLLLLKSISELLLLGESVGGVCDDEAAILFLLRFFSLATIRAISSGDKPKHRRQTF